MKNIVILGGRSEPAKCDYCGKIDELRPYGRNGANICFDCGMAPENAAATEQAFDDILDGKQHIPKPEQSN